LGNLKCRSKNCLLAFPFDEDLIGKSGSLTFLGEGF
jgi:hypothetical protein